MNSAQHAAAATADPQGHRSLAIRGAYAALRAAGKPNARWLRYHRHMLNRADDLAKLTVLDEQGKPVELGTFWRDRTAVLVFTRHFG